MHAAKAKCRLDFKQKITKALQTLDIHQMSHCLAIHLANCSFWKKGQIIATYYAIKDELSPAYFLNRQKQLQFVFPKILSKTDLIFTFEDESICDIENIDGFLVPGLAFDRCGRRLGRGGGHYDRVLAKASGWKIGLAGSYQISNEDLPEEKHDIRMDTIGTEKFILFPIKNSSFFKGAY